MVCFGVVFELEDVVLGPAVPGVQACARACWMGEVVMVKLADPYRHNEV